MTTTTEIIFDDTQFVNAHGRTPKGRGSWAFEIDGNAEPFWHNGTYAEARKAAKAETIRRSAAVGVTTFLSIVKVLS